VPGVGHVPQPHGPVDAAACQSAPIRAERHRDDGVDVTGQGHAQWDGVGRVSHITEPVTSGNTQIEGTDSNTISVTEQLRYSGNPPQTSYPITGDGHLTLSYTCRVSST
jgi:hypothetical protein